MPFIPVDKMRKLREASRNGDDRAKKILSMQLEAKEDYSSLMDEYFKPEVPTQQTTDQAANSQPAPSNPKLAEFLTLNGVKEGDAEYDDFVKDFYAENPNEAEAPEAQPTEADPMSDLFDRLIEDEMEAIEGYNKAVTEILASDSFKDDQKELIMMKLNRIKNEEVSHIKELKAMKPKKKEPKEPEIETEAIE